MFIKYYWISIGDLWRLLNFHSSYRELILIKQPSETKKHWTVVSHLLPHHVTKSRTFRLMNEYLTFRSLIWLITDIHALLYSVHDTARPLSAVDNCHTSDMIDCFICCYIKEINNKVIFFEIKFLPKRRFHYLEHA